MARPMPYASIYALPFLLAFALSVLMLATDTNLKTDFGAVPSGYYSHWYVVLATGIADLVGAIGLLSVRSRAAVRAGVVGSGLLALLFLGDVFTYGQVGFSSPSDFANYLFGITYSGGDIRYLYDALVAVYLATLLIGIALLAVSRPGRRAAAVAWQSSAPPIRVSPAESAESPTSSGMGGASPGRDPGSRSG